MTSDHPVKRRKKLIEVAIPLEAINQACQEEKAVPRRGHPGTIHFWWAPRPLAASRAIIFCQLVDDPSDVPELFKCQEEIEVERLRLFALISRLASWDNTCNKDVLNEAKHEILTSWKRYISDNYDDNRDSHLQDPDLLPPFLDPFAGGGAIPLEAQRLGMRTTAADLNPVSTIINKAKIEIPSSIPSGPPLFRKSQGDYYQNELTDRDCAAKSWPG
jgi:putative DNA methylase